MAIEAMSCGDKLDARCVFKVHDGYSGCIMAENHHVSWLEFPKTVSNRPQNTANELCVVLEFLGWLMFFVGLVWV